MNALRLLGALALVIASGCANPQSVDDVAVALPPDWETRVGASVEDTPTLRPYWFAVSGRYLERVAR